ncbi:MAG TPA: caspase family protein, partial [Anaeromyxobacteraceae bacterium]
MSAARTALAALLLLPTVAAGAARFAVVAGNDRGGAARQPLFFAEKDAQGFRRTLVELGDFADDRVALLAGAGARQFREALAAAEAKMALARSAGEKALLVVYYSGHAGAEGLELGSDVLGWQELRALVARSSAEAKVVIVDACESGGLTQVKGATAAPALDFAMPPEDSVQGTAFIASTAVGEAAQESAALGGSFFTHHLEVALRGAGDADGDGLVTLAEAFRYTAARTVSGTSGTRSGPQHPTYEFKMSGRGDVVLADLRRAEARLVLPPDPGT